MSTQEGLDKLDAQLKTAKEKSIQIEALEYYVYVKMAYSMMNKKPGALELNYIGLKEAVLRNDISHLQKCLDKGLDINHLYENNRTLIFYPMTEECMKFLLEHGADPHHKTPQNITPLHSSACNGKDNVGVIRLLLSKGIDVNAVSADGRTAAHWAFISNNMNVLRVLTIRKADLSIRDSNGKIPLDYLSRTRVCCSIQ